MKDDRLTLTAKVMYEQAIKMMRGLEQDIANLEKEMRRLQDEHANLYAMAKAYEDGNPQIRDEEVAGNAAVIINTPKF